MRILEDGNVEIRNKYTGEVKVVKPTDLPNYNIPLSNYVSEMESFRKTKELQQTPVGQPLESEMTAAERNTAKAKSEIENTIFTLENQYFGGEDLSKGRLGGARANIGAALGLNQPAKTYNQSRKSAGPKIARALGESGALTDRDIKAALQLLPKSTSTPEEAVAGFETLRDMLGISKKDMSSQAESLQTTPLGRTARAIAPAAVGAYESLRENPMSMGETAAYSGMPLLGLLGSQRYRQEVAPAGLELASLLQGASAVKKGVKSLGSGGLKGSVSRARDVAAQEASGGISVDKIIKAGDDYVAKDPLAAKTWQTVKSGLKSGEMSVADALERTSIWNKAYTSAGRVGKSGKAGIFDVLAKATKEQIKEVAPDVAAKTATLSKLYKVPKAAKGALYTAGSIGGGLGLLKWLQSAGD